MTRWLAVGAMLWVGVAHGQRPNYARVMDGLWVGGLVDAPPRGTEAVLNLCHIKNRYKADVHTHEPIHDAAPAPSLAWLRDAVRWVQVQKRAGRPAYVHCQAGISRSAMVVTAYVMAEKGLSRDKALALVREGRPQASPNPAFMDLLREYERELARARRMRR